MKLRYSEALKLWYSTCQKVRTNGRMKECDGFCQSYMQSPVSNNQSHTNSRKVTPSCEEYFCFVYELTQGHRKKKGMNNKEAARGRKHRNTVAPTKASGVNRNFGLTATRTFSCPSCARKPRKEEISGLVAYVSFPSLPARQRFRTHVRRPPVDPLTPPLSTPCPLCV